MKLREALLKQSPSLVLQRAAADEISRLDLQNQRIVEILKSERTDQEKVQLLKEVCGE